jgi:DNA polymerase
MPRFTSEPENPVWVDFETQSAADLKALGARAYLRHPSTRVLSLVALVDDTVVVWAPHGRYPGNTLGISPTDCWPKDWQRDGRKVMLDDGPELPQCLQSAAHASRTFVAHNAPFDALAWELLLPGAPQPEWFDTIPCCRAAGLPAGLDAVGERLFGIGKDKEGRKAAEMLFRAPVKNEQVVYPKGTQALWKLLLQYNVADVLLLEALYHAVLPYGEPDVIAVDSTINNRGVLVDREFARALVELWLQAEQASFRRLEELTSGAIGERNIRSVPQVKKWLEEQGLHLKSLNRQELEQFYADPEEYLGELPDDLDLSRVVEVLKLRQSATRITRAKLAKLLGSADDDGRLRGMLVYWGAHTGRWSSRGLQVHNLPRGVSGLDVESLCAAEPLTLDAIRAAADSAKAPLDDAMNTLLRPVFVAPKGGTLLIVDYANVEARGVAWVAGEHRLLDLFADPKADPYLAMASKIYGRRCTKDDKQERWVGKQVVLGAGYGLGAPKFEAYCKKFGVDLHKVGTSGEECIGAFRDEFTEIAGTKNGKWRRGGLWRSYGDAALKAVAERKPQHTNRCCFAYDGQALMIRLPSGRVLTYQNARVEEKVPRYCQVLGIEGRKKPTVCYDNAHGFTVDLYGGKIAENVVQAICRDLLATALVRLEQECFTPVLHVHDEIVAEYPFVFGAARALEEMATVMSTPPPWADGFPVGVEGFSCPRYSKSPFKDSHHVKALCGRVV